MFLAIDVGNTNIVLGCYAGGALRFSARLATSRHMEADQYAAQLQAIFHLHGLRSDKFERVVMSSVVPPLNHVLTRALAFFSPSPPHILSLADAGEVTVDIDNPAELGMDLLAAAIAVCHSRPLPAVIVDMGTATKLTAIGAGGRLLGVAIAPGLYLSLEALISGASLLQGLPLDAPPAAIGRNSPDSIRSGVVLGAAAMLDGLIDRFAEEMGGLACVVATGGAAPVVLPHCRHKMEMCETLVLDGLRIATGL